MREKSNNESQSSHTADEFLQDSNQEDLNEIAKAGEDCNKEDPDETLKAREETNDENLIHPDSSEEWIPSSQGSDEDKD